MSCKSLLFCLLICNTVVAQYQLKETINIGCSAVKSQDRTGTCWSFATISFIESEILRAKNMQVDLSEMYSVRSNYVLKAENYILRQGKANYSEGSLSHDVIRTIAKAGILPEQVYSGKTDAQQRHDHGELLAASKGLLNGLNKRKVLSQRWKTAFDALLDCYLGDVPPTFNYEGKAYTAQSFADFLDIDASNYISLTSYTHHPFNAFFVLEIPDNYSNGAYWNVPLDSLQDIVDAALKKGYSIAWDGDVSEAGFKHSNGLAIVPLNKERKDLWNTPGKELQINQKKRQQSFESKQTTDDHLMHIVGMAVDKNGVKYYKVKNSWGTQNAENGFLYMSSAYFRLHTVGILLHKDAVPAIK